MVSGDAVACSGSAAQMPPDVAGPLSSGTSVLGVVVEAGVTGVTGDSGDVAIDDAAVAPAAAPT